ncbi:MAG: hypothetical protein MJ113_02075 [Lachnospiraceae bacterium]|nr:hypothetical protein [Lachnospiraceae bacterium]
MANHFSTLSDESLKYEIELVKKRIRTSNSQQDKLMLFALESELQKRNSASFTDPNEKFRTLLSKIQELEELASQIDFGKVAGELLLNEGIVATNSANKIFSTISEAVNKAKLR